METGKFSLLPAKEIEEWFVSTYQESIGNIVTKEAILKSACKHFKGYASKEAFAFELRSCNSLSSFKSKPNTWLFKIGYDVVV